MVRYRLRSIIPRRLRCIISRCLRLLVLAGPLLVHRDAKSLSKLRVVHQIIAELIEATRSAGSTIRNIDDHTVLAISCSSSAAELIAEQNR